MTVFVEQVAVEVAVTLSVGAVVGFFSGQAYNHLQWASAR